MDKQKCYQKVFQPGVRSFFTKIVIWFPFCLGRKVLKTTCWYLETKSWYPFQAYFSRKTTGKTAKFGGSPHYDTCTNHLRAAIARLFLDLFQSHQSSMILRAPWHGSLLAVGWISLPRPKGMLDPSCGETFPGLVVRAGWLVRMVCRFLGLGDRLVSSVGPVRSGQVGSVSTSSSGRRSLAGASWRWVGMGLFRLAPG